MTRPGHYLVATEDQPRARRPADAVKVVAGLVFILMTAARAERLSTLGEELVDVLQALPSWVDVFFVVSYQLAGLYALVMLIVLVAQGRRLLGATRDVAFSILLSGFVTFFLARLVEGDWPRFLAEIWSDELVPGYPITRVVLVTAAVTALSPHVTRPLRRLGGILIALTAVGGLVLNLGFPSSAFAAIGIGIASAGAVLLVFGSPRGYPDVAEVADALRELGVETHDLRISDQQTWGTRRLAAVAPDGSAIHVKAYGRDATDSQFFAKAWRLLWYRDGGPSMMFSRLQAVEHEALVTLLAGQAGARTPEVLAAALAGDDVAILAMTRPGHPLLTRGTAATDETLAALWQDLSRVHAGGIAHGALTAHAVSMDDKGPVLNDFADGSLAASAQRRHLDVVELLFSLSSLVGVERSVTVANETLGAEHLAKVVPLLQVAALSRTGRRQIKKPKEQMKAIREAVAAITRTEIQEPVKLRRVSWRDLITAGLLLFAVSALVGQLGSIDFHAVWDVVQDASWIGILVAFVTGQLVFIPEATGMLAATGYPLPMRPLIVLQVAAKFIGLAVPSAAGRVAMNTAFLMKFGVGPALAVTQGAIDTVSGFIVEALILLAALGFTDFDLGLETGEVAWSAILLVVALALLVAIILITRVPRLHRLVVPVIKDAFSSMAGVVKNPKRALGLLGSNLASRVILGWALWLILLAVGADVSIVVALTVTVATNLLAGLVPVPGGIGVAEAVMTSWLIVVGVPEAEAVAATVVYRMTTFYLPSAAGFPAMRWLKREGYV